MNETRLRENGAGIRQKDPAALERIKIAHAALRSIGMDTKDPWGPPVRVPQYALGVSRIFTKATNQRLMPEMPPEHVLSTAHFGGLCRETNGLSKFP